MVTEQRRAYLREYGKRWVAERKAQFFADKCCATCGSTESLELDHVNPSQKLSHSIWSWSAARRETEIAKCQVLCAPCHSVKSATESARGSDHGLAKLTEADVRDIRVRYSTGGISYRELAELYGLHKSTIGAIILKQTWVHVE